MAYSAGIFGRQISIHPPREGWDLLGRSALPVFPISIHPPREGWDEQAGEDAADLEISIHPPREGWDVFKCTWTTREWVISIHPPREGWDFLPFSTTANGSIFQSTHPARGGTKTRMQELSR